MPLLGSGPTALLASFIDGTRDGALVAAVVLLVLAAVMVVVGATPARIALGRGPREELKVESGSHPARPLPTSDADMLRRIDRASVWRSVPIRRGLIFLAVGPGIVALAGAMSWTSVMVLPGLVISGVALLFGVNAWCVDGRGVLWRESLPVTPREVFRARARVLAEVLLGASLVMCSGRCPRRVPSSGRGGHGGDAAGGGHLAGGRRRDVVVGRRPFSVNLRSAR